jgi:calcineurin-like phosphoesterase family protein
MTRQWNEQVSKDDVVYHLGDFAMGPSDLLDDTRAKLNGKIILVRGNHDRSRSRMLSAGFEDVVDQLRLNTPELGNVYMQHNPNNIPAGLIADLILCGHIHDLWLTKSFSCCKIINVSVDGQCWAPAKLKLYTIEDLIKIK